MNLGDWWAEIMMKMRYRSALRHARRELLNSGDRGAALRINRVMYGDGLEEQILNSGPIYGDWIDDAERFIELIVKFLPQLMELIVLIISLLDNTIPRDQYISRVAGWQRQMRAALNQAA